ncbi:uncharacterized protein [Oryza sativa Japonica Group]|nr:uncharacterized protein LOC9270682 [Oryza sativa Japonica Group]BAG89998.1 unnamed protein product [Oryza sativa Japonica Group]
MLSGGQKSYCGGREAMSLIDRDKVSLPEIVGHLRDHTKVLDGTLLHWLFPGKDLNVGLRALLDDTDCKYMSDCICEGGVAEIYAEEPIVVDVSEDDEGRDYELEMEEEGKNDSEEDSPAGDGAEVAEQVQEVGIDATNGAEQGQEVGIDVGNGDEQAVADKRIVVWREDSDVDPTLPILTEPNDGSDSDNEYFPGDDEPSDDEEEAANIDKQYKELKKKIKAGKIADLDDIGFEGLHCFPNVQAGGDEGGNETPYEDSDSEQSIDELGSDGEVTTKKSKYPRYKKKAGVPTFELGTKFSCEKLFRKAVTAYALSERKVINFIKSDPKRVRAKCDWPSCPWVCLLSKTSRSHSWQLVTLDNLHACPPRRDNKLVTSRRIAEKYEKFIVANPGWNLSHMKAIVQEEMFADASISKLKRAKALVMHKVMDAAKGQYQKLFNYQLELLRSNPGSTVVVNREVGLDPPVIKRIYICLDALRKGFKAGCRKVIGLDGCFFKGATNGELLCAIRRDANNQMYHVAWAVVNKENNEEWDWFMDLLSRDLQVGDGEGWLFISDQQKGILNALEK